MLNSHADYFSFLAGFALLLSAGITWALMDNRRSPRLAWLAGFAVLHAIIEWLSLVPPVVPGAAWPASARAALMMAASLMALGLYRRGSPRPPLATCGVLAAFMIPAGLAGGDHWQQMAVWGVGIAGSALGALGLMAAMASEHGTRSRWASVAAVQVLAISALAACSTEPPGAATVQQWSGMAGIPMSFLRLVAAGLLLASLWSVYRQGQIEIGLGVRWTGKVLLTLLAGVLVSGLEFAQRAEHRGESVAVAAAELEAAAAAGSVNPDRLRFVIKGEDNTKNTTRRLQRQVAAMQSRATHLRRVYLLAGGPQPWIVADSETGGALPPEVTAALAEPPRATGGHVVTLAHPAGIAVLAPVETAGAGPAFLVLEEEASPWNRRRTQQRLEAIVIVALLASLLAGSFALQHQNHASYRRLVMADQRHRALFKNMGDGFVLFKAITGSDGSPTDLEYVAVNPACERFMGRQAREVVGKRVLDFIPFVEPYWMEFAGRVLKTGESTSIENVVEAVGRRFQVQAYRPQPGQLACVFRDVTEERETLSQLKLEEMRLNALLGMSGSEQYDQREFLRLAIDEGVRLTSSMLGYIHFMEGNEVSLSNFVWSSRVEAHCRAPANKHYPLSEAGIWADCVRTKEPAIHNDVPTAPGRKGQPAGHVPLTRHMSIPVIDEAGAVVLVAGVGNKDRPYDGGDVRALKLLMNDLWRIIKRRRAEEALRQSQRAWQATFDAMSDWVCLVDTNYRVVRSNAASARVVGALPDDTIGKDVCSLLMGHDCPSPTCVIRSSILSGTPLDTEVHREATGQWFQVRIDPMPGEAGQPPRVVVARDITGRKAVEGQLLQSRLSLEDANRQLRETAAVSQKLAEEAQTASRAKGQFLAAMSHEIRTPVNAIVGMTELLSETGLNDAQAEYAQTIHSSSDALLALITDILDYSRIEAGKMELVEGEFSLRRCVESVTEILSQRAAEKRLEVGCFVDPSLPDWLVGDETRVRQVALNLLANAIKFTESGEVALEVTGARTTHAGRSRVRLHLLVRDTGIGISRDKQGILFQPFTQLDDSPTRRFGGSGLGLAICRRLCELMDGRISVESTGKPGEGSRFTAEMEVSIAASEPAEEMPSPEPGARGIVVFAVSPVSAAIMARHAAFQGQTVATTALASELQAAIRDGKPGVVLLDLDDLPGSEAARVADALRGCEPAAVVVGISRGGSAAPAAEGIRLTTHMLKPVRATALRRAMARRLGSPGDGTGAAAAAGRTMMNGDTAAQHPRRILVAEDIVVNQKVILGLLARLGYSADVAENGEKALAALRQKTYDIVLMDIHMPELDGLETTRRIRSTWPRESQPWIIALTADAMRDDRDLCLSSGMDDFLTKPIRVNELVRAIVAAPVRLS